MSKLSPEPFGIGDEVAVIPGCGDWASDWRDVRLWVAAIHALPSGGFEYWVCDTWPLPEKPALTDGFYVGNEDEPDTLSLVATRTPATPSSELVEKVARAMYEKSQDIAAAELGDQHTRRSWSEIEAYEQEIWRSLSRIATAALSAIGADERPEPGSYFKAMVEADAAITRLRKALLDLLGQFDQAHDALGVERSGSAQTAIANARTALASIGEKQ